MGGGAQQALFWPIGRIGLSALAAFAIVSGCGRSDADQAAEAKFATYAYAYADSIQPHWETISVAEWNRQFCGSNEIALTAIASLCAEPLPNAERLAEQNTAVSSAFAALSPPTQICLSGNSDGLIGSMQAFAENAGECRCQSHSCVDVVVHERVVAASSPGVLPVLLNEDYDFLPRLPDGVRIRWADDEGSPTAWDHAEDWNWYFSMAGRHLGITSVFEFAFERGDNGALAASLARPPRCYVSDFARRQDVWSSVWAHDVVAFCGRLIFEQICTQSCATPGSSATSFMRRLAPGRKSINGG